MVIESRSDRQVELTTSVVLAMDIHANINQSQQAASLLREQVRTSHLFCPFGYKTKVTG